MSDEVKPPWEPVSEEPRAMHNPFSSVRFDAIDKKLNSILSKLGVIIEKENVMSKQVDDLTAAVDALTTSVGAAATELADLAAQIKANPADAAAVEDLANKVAAQATALQTAVDAAKAP